MKTKWNDNTMKTQARWVKVSGSGAQSLGFERSGLLRLLRAGAFLAAVMMLGTVAASAANYYWDCNSTTPGFGAAGGTWGSDAYWNTDSSGGSGTFGSTITTNDTGYFGTDVTTYGLAAGTVNVGTVNVGYLYFGSKSGEITLSGGTITLGATATITVKNTNTISSALDGTGGFVTTGIGTLTLSGSSSNSGFVQLKSNMILASGALLSWSGIAVGANSAPASVTRVKLGATLTDLSSGGSSGNIRVGDFLRKYGELIQEGGVVSSSGAALLMGYNTSLGTAYAGSSSYQLQGGTLSLSSAANGYLHIGHSSQASFTQTGGVATLARTSVALIVGDYANGSFDISGGSIAGASTSADVYVGYRGSAGNVTVSGSGSFGFGGNMSMAANADDSATTKGSATINLQGGTMAVNGMTRGRLTPSNGFGGVTFNFSGGTLRPYSANTTIGSATAANNFAIDLSGTGATLSGIDLASSTARTNTLYATLQGAGNVTVAGGTVSFSGTNTYTGATTVSNGTLKLSATGSISNTPTITVASGATCDVSAVTGFTVLSNQTLLDNGVVTGAVTVAAGGVVGGSGTIIGNVTNSSSSTITGGGTNSVGTLTVSNLVVGANCTYVWNYSVTGGDLVQAHNVLALPLSASVVTVAVNRVSGTWPINNPAVILSANSITGSTDLSNWVVTGDGRSGSKCFVQGNQVVLMSPTGLIFRIN
jgi:fibronectin-binding autotransporter adhesin